MARLAALVVAAILFPVRLSALAPNQAVKSGELLLVIDDTQARNKLAVAQQSLEIARADFARATSMTFNDARIICSGGRWASCGGPSGFKEMSFPRRRESICR